MSSIFQTAFEYNHHSNQKIIHAIVSNSDKVSERSLKLISHILNAHRIWNCKFNDEQRPGSWDVLPIESLFAFDDVNFQTTKKILVEHDLSELIPWTTAKGDRFENTVQDIYFHVINHSSYHRGQIATDFREHGIEPMLTDYIFYKMK